MKIEILIDMWPSLSSLAHVGFPSVQVVHPTQSPSTKGDRVRRFRVVVDVPVEGVDEELPATIAEEVG